MRLHQVHGIFILLGIIVSAIIYNSIIPRQAKIDPDLQRSKLQYEQEKVQLKLDNLRRNDRVKFYGTIALLATVNLCLLMIAGGIVRAKAKAASVLIAQIGQHSAIPVHYNDLQRFYQIALNLSLAEIEASVSTSHEQAYQISRQMIEDVTMYTRTLAGKRGLTSMGTDQAHIHCAELPIQARSPSFAELLRTDVVAPGRPIVLGFSEGQPQYRELHDLKSVAIAGWQGSGKTLSMAYLIASGVLAYRVHVYVVDPHKNHSESLYSIIQPLEKTGLVTVINPFDTPALINMLNRILDRRLAGQEANAPGIMLVIDELARLAKMEYFDVLVSFLERCTEETRKANITFIGASHKWTARHFKGRADIRGCMNSMLIHKTKPSQAHLLLEDAQDKHLVKQLQHPGEAILVTDYTSPVVVSLPLCTREDMETVAEIVGISAAASAVKKLHPNATAEQLQREAADQSAVIRPGEHDGMPSKIASPSTPASEQRGIFREVISLAQRRKTPGTAYQKKFDPARISVEDLKEQVRRRKQQNPGLTQAEIARRAGMSPSVLSKLLNGQRPLKDEHRQKLYKALFDDQEDIRLMTG